MTTNDVLQYALLHADDAGEGGYAVRYGQPMSSFGRARKDASEEERRFLRENNPMTSAFPTLFPYDLGGLESERRVHVSFTEHVRWALQYHDRRFRVHHSFPFVAFGIEQKREALMAARIQMERKDMQRDAAVLSSLTLDDLQKAAEEEGQGKSPSNHAIKVLQKHLTAMSGKVLGSDEARAANRSKIWSTTVAKNPPGLWVTISPADTHDPIAQVLAGADIDMDDFIASVGPDKDERARTIAKDPYAAAKFYDFVVNLLFETLFKVKKTNFTVTSGEGVLGMISAYFGMTEAQGRGSLHLHVIIWLEGAPTTEEMTALLQQEQFREKVQTYIRENIRAHLDGFSKEGIRIIPRDPEVPYSRPPDPTKPDFEQKRAAFERHVVRASQVHACKRKSCLIFIRKRKKFMCKRRAPFPISEQDKVEADGSWAPKRTYSYLNSWNPWVAIAMRCNHDIKFLTNGRETRAVIWYITTYATKKQKKTYNRSSLLAKGLHFHFQESSTINDARRRNKLLLFRCLHSLGREAERSGAQVISYLMGWGDVFASHTYVPVFWSSVEAKIKRDLSEFQTSAKR